MEGRLGKRRFVSIAAVCAALLLAAFGLLGAGRTDVALTDYETIEDGVLIKVSVTSSAGYIRSVKVKELDGDAMVEFYSTFGINNPRGARNEFLLKLSPECERILFRRGKDVFRSMLEKDRYGSWIKAE